MTQACGGISQPLRQSLPTLHHQSVCSSTRTALAHSSDTATTGALQLEKCPIPCRERQLQSWIPAGQGALVYCPQALVVGTCLLRGDRRIPQGGWAGAAAAAVGTCTWQCMLSHGTSANTPLVKGSVARLGPLIALTLLAYSSCRATTIGQTDGCRWLVAASIRMLCMTRLVVHRVSNGGQVSFAYSQQHWHSSLGLQQTLDAFCQPLESCYFVMHPSRTSLHGQGMISVSRVQTHPQGLVGCAAGGLSHIQAFAVLRT